MPLIVEMGPKMGGKEGDMDDGMVHEALHTLLDACEIQANKPLMEKVRALADKKKAKLTTIQGLKDHYNEKYNKPAEAGESPEEEASEEPEAKEKY